MQRSLPGEQGDFEAVKNMLPIRETGDDDAQSTFPSPEMVLDAIQDSFRKRQAIWEACETLF